VAYAPVIAGRDLELRKRGFEVRKNWKAFLEAVIREAANGRHRFDKYPEQWEAKENAPGHCHQIIGIWDSDNGAITGTECSWCLAWNMAREALAKDAK
jgi:hypothetical protein